VPTVRPAEHVPQVLIVDDDEGLLVLMAEALRAEGHAVATAASGRKALAWLEQNRADLMLLDLQLRDLDGPALLARLQDVATAVPFIVVTGQGDERMAVEMMKRGALDYVMKDTAMIDFLPSVVRRALDAQAQARALAAARAEHERLEREVIAAGERERRSIGADLHDGLGQLLTAIGLMCTALKEDTAGNQPAVSKSLDQMCGMLREAVAQTRYLARGLVPVGGEADALQNGLLELAVRTNALGRVRCQLHCPRPVLLKNEEATGHLYRIAQEAVNNALKHSGAKHLNLSLTRERGQVRLEIADDGAGLPPHPEPGLGLGLMRHRAALVGADLKIESPSRGGTVITCILSAPA